MIRMHHRMWIKKNYSKQLNCFITEKRLLEREINVCRHSLHFWRFFAFWCDFITRVIRRLHLINRWSAQFFFLSPPLMSCMQPVQEGWQSVWGVFETALLVWWWKQYQYMRSQFISRAFPAHLSFSFQSVSQVARFLSEEVKPVLEEYKSEMDVKIELDIWGTHTSL